MDKVREKDLYAVLERMNRVVRPFSSRVGT